VPILFSKHGVDRRRRNFRRRADSIGREIVSQEKQRKCRKQRGDASYYGLGTQVFLIAFGAEELARWCRAEREKKSGEAKAKGCLTGKISREARRCGHDAKVENVLSDFHRQVDTQDFVFVEREVLSARAIAPPTGKRVSAHAYQNASQSRIRWFGRQTGDRIENRRCGVFLDPSGKDHHHATQRYVSLGETTPQGRECGSAPSRSAQDGMSERAKSACVFVF
jgi:hypothetical protein